MVAAALLLLFAAATALADGPKPTIESESASNVTTTDATLEALVNPGSGEDGFALETTYEFFLEAPWCGTRGSGFCEASGGVLVYKGTIAAGATTPQLESVDLAGAGHALSPGVTYGYRVVARNEVGEAFGGEKTFTTPSNPCVEDPQDCVHPPGPPVIDSVSVSQLTPTDATLEGQVNTEDESTKYEFLMWYTPCAICEDIALFKIDLPSGLLLPSAEDQTVSLDLNSAGVVLRQGAEYGYSMRAINASGSAEAQWSAFRTPPGMIDPGPTATPGPVSNEPPVPLAGGQSSTSGGGGSPPAAGDSAAAGVSSKPAHGKPTSKHGKRHKHKHHPGKGAKHPKPKKHG